MKQFLVLFKKDFLEIIRSKKLLILCFVFLFVAVGSPIFAKLTPLLLKSIPSTPGLTIKVPEPTYVDAIDQFIKNTSQIAILVLVFVFAGAIVDEKNRRNLEILLSKPASRTKFILSKFTSSLVTLTIIYFLSALVFYYYTVTTFTGFNFINFFLMASLVLLYVLMIVSITILASTFVKNSVSAAGIGFAVFILFSSIFGFIKSFSDFSPNFIFSHYKELLSSGWDKIFIWPTLINIAIIFVAIYFAVLIFSHQEIER